MSRKPKPKIEVPPGGPFVVCLVCGIGVHFLASGHACFDPAPRK